MAEVKGFRAVRYETEKAGPLETLVAPPYDVISPDERERYRALSPRNVVHLTLPNSEDEAARTWGAWRSDGILTQDDGASFWALSQDYVGPDGVPRTRNGLVCALRAEPYERRVILPHERTHRGPKEGRLRLLRAVRAHLEPIFLLYDGEPPFRLPGRTPDLEVSGNRLWRLEENVAERFAERTLLIADGHHRYETALAFHEQAGTPETAYLLAVLVSTSDEGLTIFPTHRVAKRFDGFRAEWRGDLRAALDVVAAEPRDRPAVVVYRRGGEASVATGPEGQLDTALVESLGPEDVSYTPRVDEAVEAVDSGNAEAAFLLRPPSIEQVFEVARRGEVMPQKSTYFHPKLLSGLLFLPV